MNKIELLVCWDDLTWTTEIVNCPGELDRNDLNIIQKWIDKSLYGQSRYLKAVLLAVYNSDPEQDTDDPRL